MACTNTTAPLVSVFMALTSSSPAAPGNRTVANAVVASTACLLNEVLPPPRIVLDGAPENPPVG